MIASYYLEKTDFCQNVSFYPNSHALIFGLSAQIDPQDKHTYLSGMPMFLENLKEIYLENQTSRDELLSQM